MITPLLKKLTPNGTLVTFQSAIDQENFLRQSHNKGFRFSKFALANIPQIEQPLNGKNNIQFNAIEGAFNLGLSTATPAPEGDRVDISQSLQNYLMNIETMMIRSSSFDVNVDRTVSERLFFKWLKEIGAIRYRTSTSSEKASTLSEDRFVEEDINTDTGSGNLYDRVIRYVGDIDIEGSRKSNLNSVREIYFYAPAQAGNTPVVLFQSNEDNNYFPGQVIKQNTITDIEWIQGRTAADNPSLAGLDIHAFYDQDVPFVNGVYVMNAVADDIWFLPYIGSGPDAYYTDIAFTDPTNDSITRTVGLNSVSYIRSRLDGVGIDFVTTHYRGFEQNSLLKSFGDYNSTDAASDFKYNALLVYYDVFDKADPTIVTTNLYGVIFLDDLEVVSASGAKIITLNKIKPDKTLRKQGNSFGFKLNLKDDVDNFTDTFGDIEVSINPYHTFATEMFSEAMQRIALASENLENATLDNIALAAKIDQLEALLLTSENYYTLKKQIADIRDSVTSIVVNANVTSLITSLSNRVNEILQGQTSVNITMLLDILGYDGLKITKDGDTVRLRNLRQKYNSLTEVNFKPDGNPNIIQLKPFDNLIYHINSQTPKIASNNLIINIDDVARRGIDSGFVGWETGQSVEIKLVDPIIFGSYNIFIYTDASNKLQLTGPYQKLVAAISDITDENHSFEIVCVDSVSLKFIVK